MNAPDLLAALEPVVDVLDRLGVRYQISGSVASSAYGMVEAQWADVLGVLRVQHEALDFAYLEEWAGELEIDDLLARATSAAAGEDRGSG